VVAQLIFMKKILLIAVAVLATMFTVPAVANAGLVYDSAAFSEKRWERIVDFRPCGGQITYSFRTLPSDRAGQAILYKRADREQFGLVCRVELAERYRKYLYDNPQIACTLILHEVGHLTGRGHNNNPRSIMFGGPLMRDERCRPFRD
jgi:hypothetical protein